MQWTGLPWSMSLTSKGIAGIGGKPIEVSATFPSLGPVTCSYEAPKLVGTNTVSGPTLVRFSEQKLKLLEKASVCPAEASLSGEFSLVSQGEQVLSELGAGGGEGGETKKEEKEHKEEQEEKTEEQQEVAEEEAGLPLEGNKGKVGYEGNVGWGLL